MGRKKRRYIASASALAASAIFIGSNASVEAAERTQIATNEQALQQWAQVTGTAKPDVVPTDDGGYRVEWKAAVMNDLKHNSTTGNSLTTGTRPGTFNTLQFANEYRSADSKNNLSWVLLNVTNSNDRGQQSIPNMVNTLQFGQVGEGYRIAAGDVPVNFSALGSSGSLRGFYGERVLGGLTLAGAGGVITNTWDNLATSQRRTQYLREAYSVRAAYPWSEQLSLFATAQTYQDIERSLNTAAGLNQITALAPAKGETVTAGLNWRSGEWTLSGEGGTSRWQESGMPRRGDDAFLLQGAWQTPKYGLQVGHNDLGVYYTSLSAQAMPGVRETYARANWFATQWLSFNGDVRTTLNRRFALVPPVVAPPGFPTSPTPVPVPVPVLLISAMQTDSWSLGANVAILPINGLSLGLQRSRSETDSGSGPSSNNMTSANLNYGGRNGWQAGLGYTVLDTDSTAALFANNSQTRTITYSLGKTWNDSVAQAWNYGVSATVSDQRTSFDAGNETTSMGFNLSLNGEHVDWGRGSSIIMVGKTRDPLSGNDYDTRAIRLEWGRSFWRTASVKLYVAHTDFASNNQLIGYKDRSAGVQLAYQNW